MRNRCGYDDFCFPGWFELDGFRQGDGGADADFAPGSDAGDRS
jgi:hypothetical protein